MRNVFYFFLSIIMLCSQLSHAQSDSPCGAVMLSVNSDSCIFISGSTAGANYQNDTANGGTPNCASPGAPDVWFAFLVPSSGAVSITTTAGTISDGGMAVYSGPCSNPQFIECDDDDANGMMPVIDRTDFIPGDTIFIRFWKGWSNGTGTFNICIVESHSDCRAATAICTEAAAYHAPQNAYGKGNFTELMGQSAQCGSPEFQSHWLKFHVLIGGVLSFKIYPDTISAGFYPDYDWALFESNDPFFCAHYDSLSTVPVCCNGSSSQGVNGSTGLDLTGTSCSVQPGPGNPYSPLRMVTAGETYYLIINNFSTSSSGFDLDFAGTSAILDCNFPTAIKGGVVSEGPFAQVFPNPITVNGSITVHLLKWTGAVQFEIINSIDQKILFSETLHNAETMLHNTILIPGIYFYRIYKSDKLLQSGKMAVTN